MIDSIDGFYSVYMTGQQGQGFALVVFMAGRVVGADAGGFVFDGNYSWQDNAVFISLSIRAPPNTPRLQGGLTGPQGEESNVTFNMPLNFSSQSFVRIETPHGPVNARLTKLRGLSD